MHVDRTTHAPHTGTARTHTRTARRPTTSPHFPEQKKKIFTYATDGAHHEQKKNPHKTTSSLPELHFSVFRLLDAMNPTHSYCPELAMTLDLEKNNWRLLKGCRRKSRISAAGCARLGVLIGFFSPATRQEIAPKPPHLLETVPVSRTVINNRRARCGGSVRRPFFFWQLKLNDHLATHLLWSVTSGDLG